MTSTRPPGSIPKTTVACPKCGNLREVSVINVRRAEGRLCRACAHGGDPTGPPKPRPQRAKSKHIASAPELRVRISADTSKSFEPEPDYYCGEEISPNHYCRRHWPCPHHGDAA